MPRANFCCIVKSHGIPTPECRCLCAHTRRNMIRSHIIFTQRRDSLNLNLLQTTVVTKIRDYHVPVGAKKKQTKNEKCKQVPRKRWNPIPSYPIPSCKPWREEKKSEPRPPHPAPGFGSLFWLFCCFAFLFSVPRLRLYAVRNFQNLNPV